MSRVKSDPPEPEQHRPEQHRTRQLKSNPLSTRFVEPGRIPWHSSRPAQSLEELADYFTNKLNCRAAIVGPHGSGKSTLLEHLVPRIGTIVLKRASYGQEPCHEPLSSSAANDRVRPVVWLKLRGARPSVKLLNETSSLWYQSGSVLVLDGYEQLSWWARAKVVLATARRKAGLLLTSHRKTWLPTLVETQVDVQLALALLDQLLPVDLPSRERWLDVQRLESLLNAHRGNLREVFMQLYDELVDVEWSEGSI